MSSIENLPALALFAEIVHYGSMTRAGKALGMSRSAVSKQLSNLEAKLGTRLLQRNTRKLILTEAGEQLLPEAQILSQTALSIEALREELQGEPSGHLKISCSSGIGRTHLLPLLPKFTQQYPKIQIQLMLEDRFVDIIDEQIDVAIRVGHLADSSFIAKPLGQMQWIVVASPNYLDEKGTPLNPHDLYEHQCIFYQNAQRQFDTWLFRDRNGEEINIKVDGALAINDSSALVRSAESGMGILWVDKHAVIEALTQGTLVPVLENYSLAPGFPIYALYPTRKYQPAKSKLFIQFLESEFKPSLLPSN